MADRVASRLADVCERLFEICDDIAVAAAPAWDAGHPLPPASDLSIDDIARSALGDAPIPLAGAGVVLRPRVLSDRRHFLRWWQPVAGAEPRLLRAQLDPEAVDFRDYTTLPWYDVPVRQGRREVTGPYVDYLCTDCYSLTLTQPLRTEAGIVGVSGLDILVHDLEMHLLSVVDEGDAEWVVVNATGRVITAANSDYTTGDLLIASDDGGGKWRSLACPDLPIRVLSRMD